MESTTTVGTATPRSSVRASARASATSLLPAAVGPQTTRASPAASLRPPPRALADLRHGRVGGVEDVGAGRRYLHPGVLAGVDVRPQVDGVAAPGLADGLAVLVGAVPDVDVLRTPDLAPVSREGVALDGPQDLDETPLGHFGGHRLAESGSLGAGPGRELEDVGRVEGAVLHQAERRLVVLLGLARVPDYDVGAQGPVRGRVPEDADLAPVPLGLVTAVHYPKHPVRAGLHGQVQPLHDRAPLPDGPERSVLHVGGVARRERDPWRPVGHGLEEVAEALALVPPGVHGLAEQGDVLRPRSDQPVHLGDHALLCATDHPAPHGRHYAVAALVVAAGHYRDVGRVLAFGPPEIRRVGFLHRRQAHELRQFVRIMGTQYEVYAELVAERVGFLGGADAAGQGHLFDAAFLFEAVELAEVAADAVDGVLAHVAGVEDDDVGVLVGVHLGVARVQDHAPHPVGVVDVHLAAEGPYTSRLAGAGFACGGRKGFRGQRFGRQRDGRGHRRDLTHTRPPVRRPWPA